LVATLALAAAGCDLASSIYPPGYEDAGAAGAAGRMPVRPKPPKTKGDSGWPAVDAGMPAYDAGKDPGEADGGAPVDVNADTFGITANGKLVAFERASGALASAVPITGLADGETILGADIRPSNGKLYALSSQARLYVVDLTTGAATVDSTLKADPADLSDPFAGLRGTRFGVDWNPVPDRLRIVSDQGQNLRIQPGTGLTTTDGAIDPSVALSAAAYTNSFAAACRTRLFVIDGSAGKLFLQDPPNDGKLTAIGMLGLGSYSEVSSFEISTGSDGKDRALAAVVDGGYTKLLDVDLVSAAASSARKLQLDAGDKLVALSSLPPSAAPVQAPGDLAGVSESGRLVSFNRAAPGKLCTSVAIQGLAADERVLGIDVRPLDGKLYALGSAASLYTLDLVTGQASTKTALVADPLDTSDPFAALNGAEFAVAFNPVPDRLRVITDAGQNLRINVTTGATITDTNISGASHGATAAAYTNAFAGAKSTTLFALDTHADALVRVGGDPATSSVCDPAGDLGNPNCGVATAIGTLGLGDVSDQNGFDIDPRNGTALAALSIAGATTSTLYSIDLTSGVASLPTGVANGTIGGGERLRGLTLVANPVVSATALTADNKLLVFSPSSPSMPSAQLSISGLMPGERLIGIDVRPADGKLYAVGSTNNLYTIDRTRGAATLLSALAAASGDDNPFVMLDDCDYGFDFNPVADLLRLVNTGSANLRVAPSARAMLRLGDVVTDTWLNPGMPAVAAAAYTNSFMGSTSTTLYVLDLGTDSLNLQGGLNGTPSPNTGTLSQVGGLGVDAWGDGGFDIVGGHNGLALAALQVGEAPYALYSVQLNSGAATAFNPADNTIGGEHTAVVGLALELK
jgi:hypothetical protein